MKIVPVSGCRHASDDDVQLVISATTTTLTVHAGKFRINGVDYELAEDHSYDLVFEPALLTSITGHLVKSKTDGSLSLLVDEVKDDVEDSPYDFDDAAEYELVFGLFHLNVPANTPDLSTCVCEVRMLMPEAPPPSPLKPPRRRSKIASA